jgi:hypothetical protein
VIEIMPDIDKLQEKAAELGCSFEKGATRFAGYVLTDSDGNKPLGDTYTASLKDIERWLDNRLADAGEDVEEDDDDKGKLPVQPPNGPPMKPPTTKKTNQVLKEHSNKDEIKRALDDQPHLTRDQLKDRMRRDIAIIQTPGIRAATSDPLLAIFEDVDGCISKEDRDRLDAFSAKARADEAAKEAAEAKRRKTQYFRVEDNTKVSIDDPLHKEKVRFNNLVVLANKRMQNALATLKAEDDGLAPGDGTVLAVQTNTDFAKQSKREAAKRDRGAVPADALASLKQATAERKDARLTKMAADIKQAIAQKDADRAAQGLAQVKRELGHGPYTEWLRHKGINERTARRYLKLKTDTF